MWGKHINQKNGPDWALSVLGGVVSSVSSSSVVLCWLQCEWRLLDQSVRQQRVSQSVLLECFVFVSGGKKSVTSNGAQNSTGRAETLVSISVGRLL